MRLLLKSSLLLVLFLFPVLTIAQEWKKEFDSNFQAGISLAEIYEYERAIPFFKNAHSIAIEYQAQDLALKSTFPLGRALSRVNEFEEAIRLYLYADKNLTNGETMNTVLAQLKNSIGVTYSEIGKRDSSEAYYLLGINLLSPEDDSLQYSQLYMNLSYNSQFLEEFENAVSFADSALKYVPQKNINRKVRGLLSKYISYLWLGKSEVAEPIILECLYLASSITDNNVILELYRYAGGYFRRNHDLDKSIIYYQKGLELARKMKRGIIAAKYEYALGLLYLNLETPSRALDHLNSAHKYYESIGNHGQDAKALMKIGEAFMIQKELDQAESTLLKAIDVSIQAGTKATAGESATLLTYVYLQKKDPETAFKYLNQAKKIADESGIFWLTRYYQEHAMLFDDNYFSDREILDLSRKYYSDAQELEPESELLGLTKLAKAYYAVNTDSGFYFADLSFRRIEQRRLSLSGGMLKAGAFSEFSTFYNEVGSWYASDKKDYAHAFELFEQSKARALLDELAEAQQEHMQLSEEDQIQLLQIQKQIDQFYRQLENTNELLEKEQINQRLSSLQLEYDALLEQIKSDNPVWESFAYPEVLSLDDVQELMDNKTAIIEYAFTYEGLAIMIITDKNVHFKLVQNSQNLQSQLKSHIDHFRNQIITQASVSELQLAAQPVYELVLEPVEDYLKGLEKLVVIPDGPLSLLPFDALFFEDKYLTQHYAIKLMPSVSVFDYIPNPHRINDKNLLAVAGSGFEAGDGLFGSNSQTSFATLPYTIIEVDSIAAHFEHAKILKNESVTETGVKNQDLASYKYLHFATHGAINEVAPSQSGLILSKKIQIENLFGEDGYLNANEISQLKLNADMVVLSSCNTATGKVLSGEGLLGLQRSFLTAGASSVVASLWSIYDRSTPVFMSYFYTHLIDLEQEEFSWFDQMLAKMNWRDIELVDYKTMAVQQAKLDMIEHPYYNHPVHWASFVITGK